MNSFPGGAAEDNSVFADLVMPGAARDERHVGAARQQPAAIQRPDRPRPDHHYPHRPSLLERLGR